MALPLPILRLHLFEIDDQPCFPQFLRECVQDCLTLCWTLKAAPLQPASPATLVARVLQKVLGPTLPSYTFVDFCAGAGGPTPAIEQQVNEALRISRPTTNGSAAKAGKERDSGVDFILTDLFPHIPSYTLAATRSPHVRFIPNSVDAANAPPDLLAQAGFPTYGTSSTVASPKTASGKIFRLYNLAFHHFPDPLAEAILLNTLQTADGFAIFELQGRDVGNLFTVLMLGPLMWVGSWYWFWGHWAHLFFTYVVPIVPFVLVYDGIVSCLRTRRWGEVMELVARVVAGKEAEGQKSGRRGDGAELLAGWKFEGGGEVHTWPGGSMQFVIGIKDGK